jgi:hypothetical protein
MYDVIQLIGWAGAISLLIAFGLLTAGRIPAIGVAYIGVNFFGSIALGLSTAAAHAWPSATVNVLWLAISFRPLLRALGARRAERAAAAASAQGLGEVGEQVGDVLDAHRKPDQVLAHL